MVHNGGKLLFGNPEAEMLTQAHVNADQSLWQSVIIGTGTVFVVTEAILWSLKRGIPNMSVALNKKTAGIVVDKKDLPSVFTPL